MALAVQDANLVWQKVKKLTTNAQPGVQLAFKGLREALVQAGVSELQLFIFTEAQADVSGGTALLDGASTLYGAFYKKNTSGTDNWTWIYDDATDDTTDANARVVFPGLVASNEQVYLNPAGLAMATGVLVTQYATDPIGKSDGSDGGDGFIIVGRP